MEEYKWIDFDELEFMKEWRLAKEKEAAKQIAETFRKIEFEYLFDMKEDSKEGLERLFNMCSNAFTYKEVDECINRFKREIMKEAEKNDSKNYYTPSIEEFHMGFEFEYLIPYTSNWKHTIFGKVFKSTTTSDLYYFLKEKAIRVKYLDKSDIEGLGWRSKEDTDVPVFTISNVINKSKFDYTLTLFKVGEVPYIKIDKKGALAEHIIFSGEIKNKSELETLMGWLKIK